MGVYGHTYQVSVNSEVTQRGHIKKKFSGHAANGG